MNIKTFCILVFLLLALPLWGQSRKGRNEFYIRSFQQSALLSLDSRYFYSDYGNILVKQSIIKSGRLNYLYQGQEFDFNLNLYFFFSRVYSPQIKNFQTPDPESQFFSSYLFVAADPINNMDRDGNVSRPLILYAEDHSFRDGIDESMRDMMETFPDAHFVPLSDFINKKVGDLPEWNGHVYIKGHMGGVRGQEIVSEIAPDRSLLRLHSPKLIQGQMSNGKYALAFDAEEMGNLLRDFSDLRGVQIHSVIAAGCQGERAADGIYKGYTARGFELQNEAGAARRFWTVGLKAGKNSLTMGERTVESIGYEKGFKGSRYHIFPAKKKELLNWSYVNGKKRLYKMGYKQGDEYRSIPYIDGLDFQRFVEEGRIPDAVKDDFATHLLMY